MSTKLILNSKLLNCNIKCLVKCDIMQEQQRNGDKYVENMKNFYKRSKKTLQKFSKVRIRYSYHKKVNRRLTERMMMIERR